MNFRTKPVRNSYFSSNTKTKTTFFSTTSFRLFTNTNETAAHSPFRQRDLRQRRSGRSWGQPVSPVRFHGSAKFNSKLNRIKTRTQHH